MSDTATPAPTEGAPEAAPVEAPQGTAEAPAAPPTPPKPDPMAGKLAALAKQERETRAAREAFEKERAEFAKEKEEHAKKRALREADPLKWLEAEGLDYGALTQRAIEAGTPEAKYRSEVEGLKKSLEEKEAAIAKRVEEAESRAKALETREAEAQQRAYRAQVEAGVKGAADKFPLVNGVPNAMEHVWETVVAHAKEAGEVLTPEAAAEKVEAALKEQLAALAPVLQLPAARAILGLDAPKPAAPQAASESGPRSPRTLTNAAASAVPTGGPKKSPEMTRAQRLAAAKARFQAK